MHGLAKAASTAFLAASPASEDAAAGFSGTTVGDDGGGLPLLASREDSRSWLRLGVAGIKAPLAGPRGGLLGGVTVAEAATEASSDDASGNSPSGAGPMLLNSNPAAGADPARVAPAAAAYDSRMGPLLADWTDGAGAGRLGPAWTFREIAGPLIGRLPVLFSAAGAATAVELAGLGSADVRPSPLAPIPHGASSNL